MVNDGPKQEAQQWNHSIGTQQQSMMLSDLRPVVPISASPQIEIAQPVELLRRMIMSEDLISIVHSLLQQPESFSVLEMNPDLVNVLRVRCESMQSQLTSQVQDISKLLKKLSDQGLVNLN